MRRSPASDTDRARTLRRDNRSGKRLWARLRDGQLDGWVFLRQEPIGPYVVDFLCKKARLVVEVDGGQHVDNPDDATRDLDPNERGYRVLRVWSNDVLANIDGVVHRIMQARAE